MAVRPRWSAALDENLQSNLKALSQRLHEDDLAGIATLDRGAWLVSPDGIAPQCD